MKGHRLCTILVAMLAASFSTGHSAALQGWYDNYEEALEVARREGKPIIADFSAAWCPGCRDLEKYTLVHPQVTSRLENFVKVRVDGDQRKDLISTFKVAGLPTLVAMTPGGKEVDRQVGFVDAGSLANSLDQVVHTIGTAKRPNGDIAKAGIANDATGAPREFQGSPEMPVSHAPVAAAQPEEKGLLSRFKLRRSRPPADREVNFYNISQNEAPQTREVSNVPQAREVNDAPREREPQEEPRIAGGAEEVETQTQPRTMEISKPVIGEVRETRQITVGEAEPKPAKALTQPVVPAELQPMETTRLVAQAQPGGLEDLPRPMPMLKPVKNGSAQSAAAPQPASASMQLTKAAPAGQRASTARKSALPASIRKLQGLGGANGTEDAPKVTAVASVESVAKPTTADRQQSAAKQQVGEQEAAEKKVAAANPQPPEAATPEKPAADTKRVTLQVKSREDQSAENAEVASASAQAPKAETDAPAAEEKSDEAPKDVADSADTASAAAASEDSAETAEEKTATRADVERWMRDADQKLVAGRKKEAKAMYDKIVEDDPKNSHGLSDMAYIKAVSLIVDRDDDALRNKAYQQIRKFEALYPRSTNKDYYTLIRATLAVDLGKINEAHSLLQDFTERFPRSRYTHLAYQTYSELPAVKPESKTETVSDSKTPGRDRTDAAGPRTSPSERKVSQAPTGRNRATE